ncbi:diguanylate cyclase [Actinoplanes sp. NEAU-A12]|uniref:Diguanylate cyclase n=1 Tax=Actinoplanes sandaracinus TaxID=3045177 RepID=A0ABT6WC00_9ACTN|nr:diguanylate cyclase [Actinoplanes sandaracinus]MDI6097272.1 diguanylate cyclase [Actinoplanes sandaracinus]
MFALSTLVAAAATAASWRRRHSGVAVRVLVVACGGTLLWSAADLCGLLSDDPALIVLFKAAIFPGVCAAVAGLYCFCSAVIDRRWKPSRRLVALLAVEPVLVVAAVVTNPWHHQFVLAEVRPGPAGLPATTFGPLFWVHVAYSNVLVITTLARLIAARRHASHTHRRVLDLVLAVVLPAPIVNILVNVAPVPVVDPTPVLFSFSTALLLWGLARRVFVDLVPVARQWVLDTIDDAVIVVDVTGRVIDLNRTADRLARRLIAGLPKTLVGLPVNTFPGVQRLGDIGPENDVVDALGSGIDLNVRVSVLDDPQAGHLGWTFVVRDSTEANRRQRASDRQRDELERVNTQLRSQLHTIELLRADLAEQALRDPLTGLHNRRFLMTAMRQAMDGGRPPFALAILDIDHFKNINDTYGHHVGDEVLCHVGRLLTEDIGDDIVARYGGEEFVMVFFDAEPHSAGQRVDALRQQLANTPVAVGDACFSVTFSAGLADSSGEQDPGALLAAADAALYTAKRRGRNRVEVAKKIVAA